MEYCKSGAPKITQNLIYSLLVVLPLCAASFKEIPDESNLAILNCEFKHQQKAKIQLSNGLRVLLISDPKADQSAAVMAVGAGSWNDPEEYPGTAHFCEHMLFGGSQKYPGENEFDVLISDFQGTSNAFTCSDRTVYFFSSNHSGYVTLLNHFSRFFIDPLFNPSRIEREMYAVDQEFAKNFESEEWRRYMVLKETGNPNHPHARFSTGNSQTLSQIPQKALKDWFQEHYVAEQMRLILYSSMPLDQMKELASELFFEIPTHERAEVQWTPLSSQGQKGHLITIAPLKEMQTLILSWEIPLELCDGDSSPAHLLVSNINQGQEQSLYEALKREGLIEWLYASAKMIGGPKHLFFEITISLTEEGLEEIKRVVLRSFQALAGIKEKGISEEFFAERNALALRLYEYQERGDAIEEVSSLGETILDEPFESFPRKSFLSTKYDPIKLDQLLSFLTPQNCIMVVQADPKKTKVNLNRTEQWMGVQYAVIPFSEDSLALWSSAAPCSEIQVAAKNPFVPTHFDLVGKEEGPPVKIAEEDAGVAYFYSCSEFPVPEVCLLLRIQTPKFFLNPENGILLDLYGEALYEQFHATTSAAAGANLSFSFSAWKEMILLDIQGFSDLAPLFLREAMHQLKALKPVTPGQLSRYKKSIEQRLQNSLLSLAVVRAQELLQTTVYPDLPSTEQKLEALQSITEEQLTTFMNRLFDEVYVEAFFSGNLTRRDAEEYWQKVKNSLCQNPYQKERHPSWRILPLQEGPFLIRERRESSLGNCALLRVDQGQFSHKRRAAQQILSDVLGPSFFDALRTKQRTGYYVTSSCQEESLYLSQDFIVQSNSHHPEELLYRFELFLETELQNLRESVSEERFHILKQNLLDVLKRGSRNLKEKSQLFNYLAFERAADFAWEAKRIEGMESLTYEEFLQEVEGFLSRTNRKRVALLVEGATEDPFVYSPITSGAFKDL